MENLTNICKYLSKYETWFSYLMLYRKLASVCQTTPTGSNKKTDSYGRSYKNLFTWHVSTRLTSGIWRSRGNNCWGNSNMQMTLKNLEAHGNTRCLKRLICWMVVRAMDSKRQEDEDIYIFIYIYKYLTGIRTRKSWRTAVLACVLSSLKMSEANFWLVVWTSIWRHCPPVTFCVFVASISQCYRTHL